MQSIAVKTEAAQATPAAPLTAAMTTFSVRNAGFVSYFTTMVTFSILEFAFRRVMIGFPTACAQQDLLFTTT